jgi:hypothetical protein
MSRNPLFIRSSILTSGIFPEVQNWVMRSQSLIHQVEIRHETLMRLRQYSVVKEQASAKMEYGRK